MYYLYKNSLKFFKVHESNDKNNEKQRRIISQGILVSLDFKTFSNNNVSGY